MEEQAWLSFLYPLRYEVWAWLFINALILPLIIRFVEMSYNYSYYGSGSGRKQKMKYKKLLLALLSDFWLVGSSNFGKAASSSKNAKEDETALRILLFFILLCGNVVFMAYRASLTAELSVKRNSLPFDSPKEAYLSNHK